MLINDCDTLRLTKLNPKIKHSVNVYFHGIAYILLWGSRNTEDTNNMLRAWHICNIHFFLEISYV